jgi:hypothetical protein
VASFNRHLALKQMANKDYSKRIQTLPPAIVRFSFYFSKIALALLPKG